MPTLVESAVTDGVTLVKMRSGENRFNLPFVRELAAALSAAEASKLPVVLTGDGKYFSNGLDLEWMGREAAHSAAMLAELHRLLGLLLALSVPTAAAINGHAFGAGAMLAAACDYRVMRSDRGYFCFPEVDVGLTMSDGFNALLQSKFPKDSLHLAWTTGKRYAGEEAKHLGFVHETAGEERVVAAASEFLRPCAGKNPATLSALKKQLHERAVAILLAD